MTMKLLLLLLFIFFSLSNVTAAEPGEHQAVCPTPTIEAKRGDDVVLLCSLEPEVDLSAYTLDWKRADLNKRPPVHVYRGKRDSPKEQMVRYRDRTTLNHEELSRGNMTLRISSVQPSDSGSYECYIPKLKAGCTINLTVVEENQQNTTGPPGDPGKYTEPHWKIPVVAAVVVVAAAVVGLIVFLVKRGKSQIGEKKQEAETTSTEMNNLMPQTTTTDQHNAAENVQREWWWILASKVVADLKVRVNLVQKCHVEKRA